MKYRIEVLWQGKWRPLFEGDLKTVQEYQRECKLETRIVEAEKKK